jgi:hypothetical protein
MEICVQVGESLLLSDVPCKLEQFTLVSAILSVRLVLMNTGRNAHYRSSGNGFGAGQLTAVFPVYASEVSPPKIRGAFGGLQMVPALHLTSPSNHC